MKREDWNTEKSEKWFKTREWTNDWNVEIHPSVNVMEFAYQYHQKKELWDKVFTFLKNADLNVLPEGKHILDGDNLYISLSESPTKEFEATRWEAHKKYIDIQYVIKGMEKMGVVDVTKLTPTEPFNETKDVGFYAAPENEAHYYEANPEAFLIFFPADAHRPCIKTGGCESTRKLVVKIINAD